MSAIYSPKRTSYVKSDDPLERVYNKKGYRLAFLIDNRPEFKSKLFKFISSTFKRELLFECHIDWLLNLDNTLIHMFLTDFKILQRWF